MYLMSIISGPRSATSFLCPTHTHTLVTYACFYTFLVMCGAVVKVMRCFSRISRGVDCARGIRNLCLVKMCITAYTPHNLNVFINRISYNKSICVGIRES